MKPNELDRETPYIAYNTDLTRKAYGLDKFSQREFPAETTVEAADPRIIRRRCKISGCGTGARCRIRCARLRKFGLITIFRTSISIDKD